MTAACVEKNFGLISHHAYTILGVVELKAGDEVLHRLFKMRNPWGEEHYEGPWHDKDERWTEEFKKQVKLVEANDGIFYMDLKSFKKAFIVYNIALYNNWHTSNIDIKGTGKKFMRRLETPVDQPLIVAVDF